VIIREDPFLNQDLESMYKDKVHGNKKKHKQQQWIGDDELFEKVRLQAWFQDLQQRY
jgi:hypothetical protein